jgi:hypothetical protein
MVSSPRPSSLLFCPQERKAWGRGYELCTVVCIMDTMHYVKYVHWCHYVNFVALYGLYSSVHYVNYVQ